MAIANAGGAPQIMYVDTSNEPKTDEEAVSMITKALAVATAPAMLADLYFNLGNAQERRGFPELAADAYRSCLGVAPDRADASNNLALSLARRGSYGEAVEVARAALDRLPVGAPSRVDLWTNLGVALEHGDPPQFTEALAAYEAGVRESQHGDCKPLTNLGSLRGTMGDVAGAVDCARAAVALQPEDPYLRYNLASALDDAGDEAAAVDEYGRVLALKPELADAHNNVAALLERAEEPDVARIRRHYEAAVAHDPADYDYRLNLAAFLASEGDGGAADVYAAAAAARPDRPEALLALAELYAARGKIDEALDFAKKGKLQAPGDDRAAALLRELLTIWRDSLDETQVLADALEHEARV